MAISNNSTGLRPGVCTSTTRPTAPYEGQHIYETDTDLTYVWGGSAWQQVSGGTAVGNSGLVFVKSQTIGSAVSSIVVNDAFSANYDHYLFTVSNCVGSGNAFWYTTFSGGGNNYFWGLAYQQLGSPAFQGLQAQNSAQFTYPGAITVSSSPVEMTLYNPFLAKVTGIKSVVIEANSAGAIGSFTGWLNTTDSYTGFTLTASSGTVTGGTITVYGYRK